MKLKRILSLTLAVAMIFGSAAALPQNAFSDQTELTASAETEGDYEYKVLDDGTVEIVQYYGNESTLVIPSIINGKKVTSIGYQAFFNRSKLKSITIPNTVKSISDFAFNGCSSLTSLIIPSSVTNIGKFVFSGTKWLENRQAEDPLVVVNGILIDGVKCTGNVTIPNSVTSIGDLVFLGCSSITSVTIPNSVKSIGNQAFDCCEKLTSITIPKSVTSIGGLAFSGTKWLENQQKENPLVVVNGILIDGRKCNGKVIIPNNVKSIGEYAFYECFGLTSVTIPNSVKSIGEYAFCECDDLTSVTIPSSITSIDDYTFRGCSSLTSITIPKGVTHIGSYALFFCTSLKSVTIPSSVKSIGEYALGYYYDYFNGHHITIRVEGFTLKCYKDTEGENYAKDNIFDYELIKCIEHKYKSQTIKEPTCTSNGEKEYVCTICGEKHTETIKKLGHAYGGAVWKWDGTTASATFTCANDKSHVKTVKGTVKSTTTKPTCTANGKTVYTATVKFGGKTYTDTKTVVIEKTGHDFGEWKTLSYNFSKNTSTQTRTCAVCGKTETQTNKNAVTRLAGANRYETAGVISTKMFKQSDTVIIATGLTFHDAMVAVPLASAYDAPLLLAIEKHITAQTEAELKRLKAKNVIVVSTNGAIGSGAKAELKALGLKATYIEGKTVFETSTKVAKALQTKNKKAPDTIFFATDSAFADALSASPIAAIKNAPIIYLKNKGSIDSATANYLKSVKGKVKNAYVIGGSGVISDAMMKNVATALGLKVNKTVVRVAGANRYETCVAVNKKFKSVVSSDGICVAKGLDFPDALAGGVYAAKTRQALFLADGKKLLDCQNIYLKTKNAGKITIFGGTGAVPDELVKLIAKASV